MSDAAQAAQPPGRTAGESPRRYHCELDGWTFDPRYTEGRCPICGWRPEGAPDAPRWLAAARKFEWELTGLLVLLVVLVALAAVVANAAGYRFPLAPAQHPASAATSTHASSARPAHSSPSARPSTGPSHTP